MVREGGEVLQTIDLDRVVSVASTTLLGKSLIEPLTEVAQPVSQ